MCVGTRFSRNLIRRSSFHGCGKLMVKYLFFKSSAMVAVAGVSKSILYSLGLSLQLTRICWLFTLHSRPARANKALTRLATAPGLPEFDPLVDKANTCSTWATLSALNASQLPRAARISGVRVQLF